MSKSLATRRRRKGSLRSLLSLLVLVFFTAQSFLVQTHLHELPVFASGAAALVASVPSNDKAPISADQCLLCQEFTHSGSFVLPSVLAALPPNAVLSLLPLVLAPLGHARTASHDWKGRAPPHA